MKKHVYFVFLLFLAFSTMAQSHAKDVHEKNVKALSHYADSLDNEIVKVRNEISDLKRMSPEKYDQLNLINKQKAEIEHLKQRNLQLTSD